AFHGDDFKHYFASYAASWSPTAEPIGGAGPSQSFGPSPAAIVALGADDVVAFAGNDGNIYDHTRHAGSWSSAHSHMLGNVTSLTPALAALDGAAADLMLAFVRGSDARILSTVRTSSTTSTWSAPAVVDNLAFTNDPPSLIGLPGGDALLVYRGQDTN